MITRTGLSAFCAFFTVVFFPEPSVGKDLVISSDMQYQYAQKLLNDKDYETAAIEFKRFVHFFPEDEKIMAARFHTGLSLYHAGKYKASARIFNALILEKADHPYKTPSYFFQSNAFRLSGNMAYARIVLLNLIKITRDPLVKNRAHTMLADLSVESSKGISKADLNAARDHLMAVAGEDKDAYRIPERLAAVEKALDAPEKNPVAAGIAAIIPGGGFLYCERYQDALVAFLVNAGLIYAAYDAFDDGNEGLGGVLAFVETGFYTGNIYGSITAAHRRNQIEKIRILNREFKVFSRVDVKESALFFGLMADF